MLDKKQLKSLFQKIENLLSEDIKDIDKFSDEILDLLSKYQENVQLLLDGKTLEEIKKILDKNTDKKIKRAVDIILKAKKPEENKLDFPLFLSGKPNIIDGNSSNKKELKTIEKYEEFLKVFYSLFFGDKNVEIKVFIENLASEKMRKIPYRVIHFYSNGYAKTFLISDQIGEATFVYDGIIDEDNFRTISKGEVINGVFPAKIIYGKNYKNDLLSHLKNEVDFKNSVEPNSDSDKRNIELEEFEFNKIYYKTLFTTITDKDGNKKIVNLETIGVNAFSKLYFGKGTRFRQIFGNTLLYKFGGIKNTSLKMILKLGGIERPDLPDEDIDYTNNEHIKELFTSITDKDGNKKIVNLETIGVDTFRKLYFGKGTRFGQIFGETLLKRLGFINNTTLKKLLKLGGIERFDLPDEDIDYTNNEHLKELFTIITDKDGNKEIINLETIGVNVFSKLHFGKGTRFGQISGNTLLKRLGLINNTTLKKLLKLGGIERPDLPDQDIDYTNNEHIKELFTSITDKDGNKVFINLKTIGVDIFRKLYFGKGTRFGQISGNTLLRNKGGINLISIKKLLLLLGIERMDL